MFPSLLALLVQIGLIVHVVKTGRNTIWIWVLFVPVVGPLAYLVAEVLPDILGSHTARRAARGVTRTLDPGRDLRHASAQAAVTDTVAAKLQLGAALARRRDYAAAIETYRSGLKGLYEHDPTLLLGLAEAQFASGDAAGARTSLELLRANNPDFRSSDGDLLYARAVEASGNLRLAETAYRAAADRYPGAEAKVRLAQCLRRAGKADEATTIFEEVLKTADIAPRHVRRAQAEWIALAARELGR